MADIFSKKKRSEVMSRIKGCNNEATEIAFLKILKANNITGWRRHEAILGSPDFVFRKMRVIVFVDGCFWHGCPKHYKPPKDNREFWKNKIQSTRLRDNYVTRALRYRGWHVIRIWECQLTGNLQNCLAVLAKTSSDSCELSDMIKLSLGVV